MGLTRTSRPAPVAPPASVPELITTLQDPDQEVRRRAVLDLDGCVEAVPALLALAETEPEPVVRDAVFTVLVGHDHVEVARSLARHLSSDDAGLRSVTVEALGLMREGIGPLLPGLVVDPDADVRILVAHVLGRLQRPDTVAWLTELVEHDEHPNVVAAAVDAVLPHLDATHRELLHRARDRFGTDPFLRFTVDSAVAQLSREDAR